MQIEFGIEVWNDGVCREIHEDDLRQTGLASEGIWEGWVRIRASSGAELMLRDELPALLSNLGFTAPVSCLGEGRSERSWLLMARPEKVCVDGSKPGCVTVRLSSNLERPLRPPVELEVPAHEFWVAAFAAAVRFTELLTATLGPADGRVIHLVGLAERARAVIPGGAAG